MKKQPNHAVAIVSSGKGPWYDWLNSDVGKRAADPGTLCPLTISTRNYLENRLWQAFTDGMKIGFEQGKSGDDRRERG